MGTNLNIVRSCVVGLALAACTGSSEHSEATQGVTTTNGLGANGLATNGIWQNGIWQNGIWQNGIWQNGIWQNGIWQNGIWQNGIWQNGIWQNGLAGDQLRENPYTRQLMQYIYACAMPGTTDPLGAPIYATSIDPNAGKLACNSDGSCDEGYSCSSQNTCVVPLVGSIGVGVNFGGSTWAESGHCDETCQRWVSACVLARTNAYGFHVDISMRAPDSAPQAIKDALAVTDDELASYPLREGAYYGNLFATTPVNTMPPAGGSGPEPGAIAETPSFFACAGPGSNIPEITKRFCSSQGDTSAIDVLGTCLPAGADPTSVCSSISDPTVGALDGCSDNLGASYSQVITVYLKQPFGVCGDSVCDPSEDPTSCPADCHPGTWGRSFDGTPLTTESAAGPNGIVYMTGQVSKETPVDFGTGDPTPTEDEDEAVVLGLGSDGSIASVQRIDALDVTQTTNLTVGPDGTLYVVAGGLNLYLAVSPPAGSTFEYPNVLAGNIAIAQSGLDPQTALAYDASSGNLVLAGTFQGELYGAAGGGDVVLNAVGTNDVFVMEMDTAGDPLWIVSLPTPGGDTLGELAVDGNGDIFLTATLGNTGGNTSTLLKLSGSDGSTIWSHPADLNASFDGVTVDANNDVYISGDFAGSVDIGGGPMTAGGQRDYFAAKFAGADGAYVWTARANATGLAVGEGGHLLVDPAGNIVVAGHFGTLGASTIDFGAGPFYAFSSLYNFVAAYTPDGRFLWAKEIPMVLDSLFSSMTEANGQIVLSGSFSGSMQVDSSLLVNAVPEQVNHKDVFVAGFIEPPPFDQVPPVVDHTTLPFVIQATSSQGATGWFAPPTVIDNANAGTSVSCSPPSGTTFGIGTTQVTCNGYDPEGNKSTSTFTVTVHDTIGPAITNLPNGLTAEATSAAGAPVLFTLPTAVDQVSGPADVTCSASSGQVFQVGSTIVTCSSTDANGNSSTAAFPVTVKDSTPPVITAPTTVSAGSGGVATYSVTAFDVVGGTLPVSCAPASGSVFATGTTTVTCTATDAAGNTATAAFPVTRIGDTTPPVLTPPAQTTFPATGPGGAIASYAVTAVDDVDGPVAAVCLPPSGSMFPVGSTPVTCTAHDKAGNVGTLTFTLTVVDTTPPTITVPSNITAAATSNTGATVTYAVSASDTVSGTVTPTCTVPSGSKFPLGTTTVTCTASDASGNHASASFQVLVDLAWSGILQPINANGSSIFLTGSTVRVRLALQGASAAITNLAPTLTVTKLSSTVAGTQLEFPVILPATPGLTFRYNPLAKRYYYDLGTSGMSSGTYQVTIDLHDGVAHTATFSVKTFTCGACHVDNDND